MNNSLQAMGVAIHGATSDQLAAIEKELKEMGVDLQERERWIVVEKLGAIFDESPWLSSIAMEWCPVDQWCRARDGGKVGVDVDADELADFLAQEKGGAAASGFRERAKQALSGGDESEALRIAQSDAAARLENLNWPALDDDWKESATPMRMDRGTREDIADALLRGGWYRRWEAARDMAQSAKGD